MGALSWGISGVLTHHSSGLTSEENSCRCVVVDLQVRIREVDCVETGKHVWFHKAYTFIDVKQCVLLLSDHLYSRMML